MKLFGLEIKRARTNKYDLRKISRIEIADDDVLVVHCERNLSAETAQNLQDSLTKIFGNAREVLVLDKGVTLTVVSGAKDENSS